MATISVSFYVNLGAPGIFPIGIQSLGVWKWGSPKFPAFSWVYHHVLYENYFKVGDLQHIRYPLGKPKLFYCWFCMYI